jgi:hypothetical protein
VWITRAAQRLMMALGDNKVVSDVEVPSPWLNRLLYALVETERRWLKSAPFGSSIFLVLAKKDEAGAG